MPKYLVNASFYGTEEDAYLDINTEVELTEERANEINEKLANYASEKEIETVLTLIETKKTVKTEEEGE
ncbi:MULTISPECIES: hypothetical protein [Pseudomonadati]|nr:MULTISPECIES: hypothetical protein [Bacteria]KAB5324039.1 hypothetical protein F9951_16765 [Bacteroides stercoris]MRY69676.1 hypothetical protein [Parabacteroides distasonis]MTU02735.1 hypothetical protein [Parasutterella excrementihominis]MTU19928.1 hypothetical protein [Parasutterella excrementihominis]MTU24151.1 hypothetical protein [Parasutterella excrementihominis]